MRARATPATTNRPIAAQVKDVLAELTRLGTKATRDGMTRYGMPTDKAFGVPVNAIQRLARSIGPNHALALALWDTGWYEARMVAAYVGEPARLTPAQMDRWCREFDNWGICDTVCFVLFDRTPHAWGRIPKWAGQKDEFVRRGGFVLLACLALHDKGADDESFTTLLPLIERGATDERNFVKKGVSWALRAVGRRSTALNKEALAVSRRLAGSSIAAARWVGKDALRELTSPAVARRLSAPRRRQQHGRKKSSYKSSHKRRERALASEPRERSGASGPRERARVSLASGAGRWGPRERASKGVRGAKPLGKD